MLTSILTAFIPAAVGHVAKAVAGSAAATASGVAGAAYLVPGGAEMSLLGYIVVGALNGAVTFATVYFAPANR